MPGKHSLWVTVVCAATLFAGCANLQPRRGFLEVEEEATKRLGAELAWRQSGEEDAVVRERVSQLLAETLSPDTAVQIALLQNPDLQVTYEALGVAQADMVQAGMLENPVLVAAPRFGVGSISGTNLEMDIAQNLLQLATLRSKKKLARTQFHEARLRVSHQVLEIASEVREAYYELVASRHLVSVLRTIEETTSLSSDYATRLHEAGNISDLALARERALYEEARVAREIAEAAGVAPHEQLVRLLGLDRALRLETSETLPPLPRERVATEGLEGLAISNRLDLQALAKEIDAFEQALSLSRFYRWIPFVEAGVSAEREVEGGWVIGPQLALEIPIFDQGQAQVARFESMVRERKRAHEALSLDIRRDVRIHAEALRAAHAVARNYLRTLIPLRERIVRLTHQEYNFMLVGAFELLSAKRDEIESYQHYVEALRGFWTTRARLRGALGGVLPLREPGQEEPEPAQPDEMEMHGHDHGSMTMPEKKPAGGEMHHHGHGGSHGK